MTGGNSDYGEGCGRDKDKKRQLLCVWGDQKPKLRPREDRRRNFSIPWRIGRR